MLPWAVPDRRFELKRARCWRSPHSVVASAPPISGDPSPEPVGVRSRNSGSSQTAFWPSAERGARISQATPRALSAHTSVRQQPGKGSRGRRHPILDPQTRHPLKLAPIVGNHHKPFRSRVARNHLIIGADLLANTRQLGAKLPSVHRSFLPIPQHLKPRRESFNVGQIPLNIRGLFPAVDQLQ